ncbi:hypothetical protein CA267_001730 [Alteromonas pelagimontana]|uniref:ABC transporter ATP-binding protein n=1 Tax=Alteromonas pelagimontana TaxID=1858656 RepID=A0A6M4M8T1_9ALTE|nr:hypothetical protein [Alteromonas pelagimontana]QJR79604.1 hypothetical protein CA267_001730 [Alteromonas pelagimontana]
MITHQSNELIKLYHFYRKGVMAVAGGIYDQPVKYVDAMQIIEAQVNSE